jgi:acetyl esterase/lipase
MEDHDHSSVQTTPGVPVEPSSMHISDSPIDVGATTHVPSIDPAHSETILLTTKSGEHLKVDKQVHLYALNSQLVHPLISPALSYLGGLPPLLIIASEKEVLRDEIIYT